MARARRAKPRRSRALLSLIVVALLAGAAVAALRFWPGSLVAIGPTPTPAIVTTAETEPTSPAAASPSPTAKAAAPASATPASADAVRALESCRERVQAADEVLKQARTGISHWEAHVDAERAAESDEISGEKQQAIFKATRLQGPKDQQRYADAQRDYDRVRDAPCGKTKGADAKVATSLASCRERAVAQGRLMAAAAAPMGDWKSHLTDMQRSREVHVDNAQQVWIEAYEAAPPAINAYEKDRRSFDPPRC